MPKEKPEIPREALGFSSGLGGWEGCLWTGVIAVGFWWGRLQVRKYINSKLKKIIILQFYHKEFHFTVYLKHHKACEIAENSSPLIPVCI